MDVCFKLEKSNFFKLGRETYNTQKENGDVVIIKLIWKL